MRITIVLTLTAWMFLSSCGPVYAQEENDIGKSLIHPASPFYFLKAIRENLELRMAFTPRVKMFRSLEFATRRLREARALTGKNEDLIPASIERYKAQISGLPDKGLIEKEVALRIKESLVVHVETLLNLYNQISSFRAKMSIRSALNRIIQRADTPDFAKSSVCNFFLKEASSSALNDVERVILMERGQVCQKINK